MSVFNCCAALTVAIIAGTRRQISSGGLAARWTCLRSAAQFAARRNRWKLAT